jgi:two-component system, chemotaxis family, chemotaxis protein CheY
MLIDIINYNAEKLLLALLEQSEQHPTLRGALYFRSSVRKRQPQEDEVLLIVRPLLQDKQAAIYFFHDGDLVITWCGVQKIILQDLCKRLYAHFQFSEKETLHTYYDFNAHGEDLRLLCKRKLNMLSPESNQALSADGKELLLQFVSPSSPATLDATPEQIIFFQNIVKMRKERKRLEMLVVEDQPFSNKLLVSLLDRIGKTYSALNAERALEMYLSHAPDIVFLDIEMPDASGHELTLSIRKFDPDAYIIMVTANHYVEDVKRAKNNGAKGFVAKPYSKQKILVHVENYIHEHKLKPRGGTHE